MKKTLVSIIIVNWNGLDHLRKCLPSLAKILYNPHEIIVVDNASTDGSVAYIKNTYKNIKIVKNKKNLGFAGGNNAALKYVNGKYLLFLNNDTVVTKDFLNPLVDALENDIHIGGVQSKILSLNHPDRMDSIGAFLTNTGFLYHYGYFQKNLKKYDHDISLYTAKGACMMFRKSVIDEVGLFDSDFFAYFEETDFCHRVWLAGYEIKYVPQSIIYHKIGGTSNAMNNAFIQFHSFKNRINSYIKNLGIIELIKILPVHILLCEISAVGFILKNRMDLFFAINKSIFWNISNLSETLEKRRYVQKNLRKVSDRDIMEKLKVSVGYQYYYSLFTKSLIGYVDKMVIIK